MNQTKVKQLLDKSKNVKGVMIQTHDTPQERNNLKREMKQVIDTTTTNKNYVIVVFEI